MLWAQKMFCSRKINKIERLKCFWFVVPWLPSSNLMSFANFYYRIFLFLKSPLTFEVQLWYDNKFCKMLELNKLNTADFHWNNLLPLPYMWYQCRKTKISCEFSITPQDDSRVAYGIPQVINEPKENKRWQ